MAISALSMSAQAKLTLNVGDAKKTVSPTLYGLMTEEINYSYEGGLYAQLLQPVVLRDHSPDRFSIRCPRNPNLGTFRHGERIHAHRFRHSPALADSPRQSKTEANSPQRRHPLTGLEHHQPRPGASPSARIPFSPVRSMPRAIRPSPSLESTDGKTVYAKPS